MPISALSAPARHLATPPVTAPPVNRVADHDGDGDDRGAAAATTPKVAETAEATPGHINILA